VVEHATWRALGTSVHLLTDGLDAAAARRSVECVLDEVDATYSRFRPDSELRQLETASGRAVRISPLLRQAIAAALRAARETGGAVDPTVGRAMRAIGYDDDFSLVARRPGPLRVQLVPIPGWQAVQLDEGAQTVRIPSGVELDLGSTGKALAADLAVEATLRSGASVDGGVLVSLGGDIATAGAAPGGGWRVLMAEDADTPADSDGEVVAIDGGSIATSSITVRRWRGADGRQLHHLIDPATGAPAQGPWRTASVAADRCVDANAAATAALVLGDSGRDWLEGIGLPARLVATDGQIVRIGGWPEPDRSGARASLA
jgi:FAD:protein FMN transferase